MYFQITKVWFSIIRWLIQHRIGAKNYTGWAAVEKELRVWFEEGKYDLKDLLTNKLERTQKQLIISCIMWWVNCREREIDESCVEKYWRWELPGVGNLLPRSIGASRPDVVVNYWVKKKFAYMNSYWYVEKQFIRFPRSTLLGEFGYI